MNAFATAMNVIFADPNMAVDALWFASATGPGIAIRVIRKSPDEITPFGAGRILSEAGPSRWITATPVASAG